MAKLKYWVQERSGGPIVEKVTAAGSVVELENELWEARVPVLKCVVVEDLAAESRGGFLKRQTKMRFSMEELRNFAGNMLRGRKMRWEIPQCLSMCEQSALTREFAYLVSKMRVGVIEGRSLFEVMKESGAFDGFVLGCVDAGERSAQLLGAFQQIKDGLERDAVMKKKVRKVMRKPLITLFVTMIVVFVLMWKVVPTFVQIYASNHMSLPMMTRVMMAGSSFVTHYPVLIALGIVAVMGLLVMLGGVYDRYPALHPWVLKLPVIGHLQKLLIREAFCRTFGSLLKSRFLIVQSLQLVRGISECFVFRGSVARAVVRSIDGDSLVRVLEEDVLLYGQWLIQNFRNGEETASLGVVAEELSEQYREELMEYIDHLEVGMEPMMMMVLSVIVGGVVTSLFLPLYEGMFAM